MKRLILGLLGCAFAAAAADADPSQNAISIASTGNASAKADLAIVFLTTRSTAPLAADALEQNTRKVAEISARLDALGYKGDQVKWSGHRFSPAGQGMYYPGGQRPTGFDVYNNLYVFLEGDALKDVAAFNAKVGRLLDELSKIGASPATGPAPSAPMGRASVVAFTVRDAAPLERQAYQDAMNNARPLAEVMASRMNVQLSGVTSVHSQQVGRRAIMGGPGIPLDDLPYDYFSPSADDVSVRVMLVLRYGYK